MRVLVVDDEENVRKGIATFLGLSGHEAVVAANLAEAQADLIDGSIQAALVDLYIGRENGASLLDFAAERRLATPIIMMSGRGSVKDAVAAVRSGAYDFIEKPLDTDRLLAMLRNLERESAALRKLDAFRDAWLEEHVYVGSGSALEAVFDQARKAAASPLSILVSGPTGSGKELVARWIHLCSPRSQGPFIAVNCAAIPPDLGESAFFGSRKGSYTGSNADRPGYFEASSGGTLFLDEIGEISLGLQAALLRAVETGEIQPVGAEKSCRVDTRIVAATNRNLSDELIGGVGGSALGRSRADNTPAFRADLYWRLAQVQIKLPPLLERPADIRGLAEFLAAPIRAIRGAHMGRDAPSLGQDALAYLESRPWPGNVRELRAFLERALWLAPAGSIIDRFYLAELDAAHPEAQAAATSAAPSASAETRHGTAVDNAAASPRPSLAEAKENFERAYVREALDAAGGSVAKAAELLGLLPNNLSRKLKELGLR